RQHRPEVRGHGLVHDLPQLRVRAVTQQLGEELLVRASRAVRRRRVCGGAVHGAGMVTRGRRYNSRIMTTTIETQPKPATAPEAAVQRQFVNFQFFRVDRAFRSESWQTKTDAKRELGEIITRYTGPMMLLPYSTLGLKTGVDFMLWRIGYDLDPFQQMVADIN